MKVEYKMDSSTVDKYINVIVQDSVMFDLVFLLVYRSINKFVFYSSKF